MTPRVLFTGHRATFCTRPCRHCRNIRVLSAQHGNNCKCKNTDMLLVAMVCSQSRLGSYGRLASRSSSYTGPSARLETVKMRRQANPFKKGAWLWQTMRRVSGRQSGRDSTGVATVLDLPSLDACYPFSEG